MGHRRSKQDQRINTARSKMITEGGKQKKYKREKKIDWNLKNEEYGI